MKYDGFLLFNELDLLRLRLETLAPVMDRFVLVEATKTFSGKPKPLFYQENNAQFSRFHDQIIHIVLDDEPPEIKTAWDREHFQRNQIMRGLTRCDPSDRIFISDLDEIPDPTLLDAPLLKKRARAYQQFLFGYCFNCINKTTLWRPGTCVIRYDDLTQSSPEFARTDSRKNRRKAIPAGGWHFSFLGDAGKIAEKISAFSHQEYNTPEFTDPRHIQDAVAGGQDLFGRSNEFVTVALDSSFPPFLLENQHDFSEFIRPFDHTTPTVQQLCDERRKNRFKIWRKNRVEKIMRGLSLKKHNHSTPE